MVPSAGNYKWKTIGRRVEDDFKAQFSHKFAFDTILIEATVKQCHIFDHNRWFLHNAVLALYSTEQLV